MKEILVVGDGGREHAIARQLVAPGRKLYVAPGNAGTANIAENVSIDAEDASRIAEFARKNSISFTVVGPEVPLAKGIVDEFTTPIFGPSGEAARIESSKVWAARFQERFIDNKYLPKYWIFDNYSDAKSFVENNPRPMVVKADRLARGKGVFVCNKVEDGSNQEALDSIKRLMVDGEFNNAGRTVVIQEFLEGSEASVFVLSDGKTLVPLINARDYKRLFDNDEGPNTGGVGSYAPFPMQPELMDEILRGILIQAIDGMREIGVPYKGVLYAGIMLTKSGPKLLEFNCRFGDPESQVILPLLDSDLLQTLTSCVDGTLEGRILNWKNKSCVCVVLSPEGYPDSPLVGREIYGLREFAESSDIWLIHAGTKYQNGRVVTSGGRALGVCTTGDTMTEAVDKAYSIAGDKIYFGGMQYRKDIGRKAIQ